MLGFVGWMGDWRREERDRRLGAFACKVTDLQCGTRVFLGPLYSYVGRMIHLRAIIRLCEPYDPLRPRRENWAQRAQRISRCRHVSLYLLYLPVAQAREEERRIHPQFPIPPPAPLPVPKLRLVPRPAFHNLPSQNGQSPPAAPHPGDPKLPSSFSASQVLPLSLSGRRERERGVKFGSLRFVARYGSSARTFPSLRAFLSLLTPRIKSLGRFVVHELAQRSRLSCVRAITPRVFFLGFFHMLEPVGVLPPA